MRRADLTERQVASLTKKPGLHWVSKNLYLDTREGASWIFRYMLDGEAHYMGLGAYPDYTLAEARERARQYRRQAQHGADPITERRAQRAAVRLERAKARTFRQCAGGYLQANESSWKNAKHRQQWRNTLATYVLPVLGDLPIQQVDEACIVRVLLPIWHEKSETARRVRMRIQTIIEWAIASKFFIGDNPAKRERLKHLLGAQGDVVKHHTATPYEQIGDLIAKLRKFDGIGALPLEFCTLTATRTGEVLGADWSEIDWSARTWTIPSPRRKGKKGKETSLIVPLSGRCLEILETMAKRTGKVGLIFRSPEGRRLSENTLNDTLTRLGHDETTHGMRSTFRDWAGDRTNFPRDVVEMALGHKVGNEVERAYRRGSALEKRRQLMNAWDRFCAVPVIDAEVVSLAAGGGR